MRCIPVIIMTVCGLISAAAIGQQAAIQRQGTAKSPPVIQPSEKTNSDFPQWNDPKYEAANSAREADYLTDHEKRVYYYLNLVRMNPKLFADTYLQDCKNSREYYKSSLYRELQTLKPLPVLKPDRALFQSAECHARVSGERGYIGHDRVKCKEYFAGECCHYGQSDALEIVTSLLIDYQVSSLGHRRICLGNYTELGVAIRPHKNYHENTVLDFH